tara:strand:+ start:266 stop:427 length:162 start_codon:yes stop_codon:yes gene_type:complete
MATRAEVSRTDNSKLGRAVLNNRVGQSKAVETTPVVETKSTPVVKKTKTTKKS